ncbi:MAG: CinA family nicotinamide mononucleotide deamidase-related protein [Polyangiales bacterium]
MQVAILTIGTELTRGELVDSNAAWLSAQLTELGCQVLEHCSVDDAMPRIVAALERLAAAHPLLLVTGGLGPTSDDRTAAAAATVAGVPLQRHLPSLERIRRRWATRGAVMPESNAKQADLPAGAEALPNERGTAPGFVLAWGQTEAFFLPGVPDEMKGIYHTAVASRIAPRVTRQSHQVHLRTFGMAESSIADALAPVEARFADIDFAYRAHFPEIEVKVCAHAGDWSAAESRAQQAAEAVRTALGGAVYGDQHSRYPGHVSRILREKGVRLALAESCTGGMISAMLTSVPGSSEFLLLDAVVYANAAKQEVLGVPTDTLRAFGAVSAECAAAMAEGALRVADADLALAITGLAGPGGASENKPIGTVWMALAQAGGRTETRHHQLSGDRERIRLWASYLALQWIAEAAPGRARV